MIRFHDRPSPNHDVRGPAMPVDMLVLHYTGMRSGDAALSRLCDETSRVSAHYAIEEDGRIFRLVPEERRAWHAGVAYWRRHTDINARSIGIELVNPGHEFGYRAFPEAQMAALEDLVRDIFTRHGIAARNIVAHADIAPERKEDPGELFDWRRLARAGIGLWPEIEAAPGPAKYCLGDRGAAIGDVQEKFAAWGFDLPPSGVLDSRMAKIVTAFQRHFRPQRIDGNLDDDTLARLDALLRVVD